MERSTYSVTEMDYAGMEAVKKSAMASLEEATAMLEKVGLLASETADALCGSMPSDQKDGNNPISNGVFARIENIAARLRNTAGSITGDMNRIQNHL